MKFNIDKKNIKSFEYDAVTGTLEILFQSGRKYRYHEVSVNWLTKLISSEADKVPSELSKIYRYEEI